MSAPCVLLPVEIIRIFISYASELRIGKIKFRGIVPVFVWRESSEPFRKNHSQYIQTGLNPDLPVIGNLVYCKSDAFDHVATEAGRLMKYGEN
ncbi:unnamed protein product [Timema podura]|uniref:Uncharacterized protein n=1 Tax=Timema podura TaxID=61482 RepID=A0ABN7NFR4_TIMPD|nr:unnamed protein product [Timema podura]